MHEHYNDYCVQNVKNASKLIHSPERPICLASQTCTLRNQPVHGLLVQSNTVDPSILYIRSRWLIRHFAIACMMQSLNLIRTLYYAIYDAILPAVRGEQGTDEYLA